MIVVSRTVADGDLINPDAESKTLENDSSDDGILRGKFLGSEMPVHILHF